MRINRVHLTHFGCFHRKCVEFKPGINVIYGENEAGKSTVHRFIQAMLFGVERLRGKASKKDEYTRFQPWHEGKNYEGSMEIEHEHQTYRLTRNFYREEESFKVEQLETGMEIRLAGQQLDQLIEGLNRSNFKNTLSISQMEAQIDRSFGLSLQAYMANVAKTKNQAIDLGKTLDYLRRAKKQYLNSEASQQLKKMDTLSTEKNVLHGELERVNAQIAKREEELEQITQEIRIRQRSDKERSRYEQRERMEAVRLLEENNHIAEQYRAKKREYERLKQTNAEHTMDTMREAWNTANETYEDLSESFRQMLGRNMAIVFSIAMFGLIPVVAVFFFVHSMTIRAFVAVLYVLVLLGTTFILRGSRKRMKRKVSESRNDLQTIQQTMESQMFGEKPQASLQQLKEELRSLREQYDAIQIPLQPYLEKYGDDISLETETDTEEALEYLNERREHVVKSLERHRVQKENLERAWNEQEDLENELQMLKQEVQAQEEQAAMIEECMQLISELSEEIHSDFGPALNREVSRMINTLTEGRYQRVVVDKELTIKLDTENGFVTAEQLSTGTREQLYLALRLAMVNVMYPEKNMPILFDDSFVYYDDVRLEKTLAWLMQQGYEQILIFTCQHREIQALEKLHVPYHEIGLS